MSKDLDEALRLAGAAQRLAMERALAAVDLTPSQFVVMEWLERIPGLSGAEIARHERLTAPTSSVIIANLERKGHLARKARAGGGRAQYLELTPLGRTTLSEGARAVAGLRDRLAADLDPLLLRTIVVWLRTVSEINV